MAPEKTYREREFGLPSQTDFATVGELWIIL